MTDLKVPDESALLYRRGYLTGIPATPGGPCPEVTELLYLNRYGNTLVSTIPHVDLGHGIISPGQVQSITYTKDKVAAANFRAMLIKHTQPGDDGFIVADLEAFTPGDPSTLQPAPRRRRTHTIGTP